MMIAGRAHRRMKDGALVEYLDKFSIDENK